MKKILSITLVVCVSILLSCDYVKASPDTDDRTIGVEVVGKYSKWGDELSDLKSPMNIADSILEEFKTKPKGWSVKFCLRDETVWETDFKGVSIGGQDNKYIDGVDLFIYSGHGLKPKKHGADDYSFALNSNHNSKYAKQSEMYIGNGNLEWLVTFTCNFLESNSLDKIGHMAKGVHAICGYKTTVILSPDMGKVFVKKLKNGVSVKEAFFATAKETKVHDGGLLGFVGDFIEEDVIGKKKVAAVFTTKKNANDRIWGYGKTEKDPKAYSKDKSGYILYSYEY